MTWLFSILIISVLVCLSAQATSIQQTNIITTSTVSNTLSNSAGSQVTSSNPTKQRVDSLNSIIELIEKGSIKSIQPIVNAIIENKKISCQQKLKFVDSVSAALLSKQSQNKYEISKVDVELQSIENLSEKYDNQRKFLQGLEKDINKINYDAQIKYNQAYFKLISDKITRLTQAANRTVNKLKSLPQNTLSVDSSIDIKNIQKQVQQVKNLDRMIAQIISKKQKIDEDITNITISKLNEQIYKKRNILQEARDYDEYQRYSRLQNQASFQYREKKNQLQKLNQQLRQKEKVITIYDLDIQTTQQQLDKFRKQYEPIRVQLVESNKVLQSNARLIQGRIKEAELICP